MASTLFSCKRCIRLMHLQKQFYLRCQAVTLSRHQNFSSNTAVVTADKPDRAVTGEKIVIPLRKKRDELSVLKALASTVRYNYSAPHYNYIDDPYTIPQSGLEKRSYSLSKASGKRAARYVVETYPLLFENNPAAPTIEAFMPLPKPEFSNDSLEGLQERIDLRQPLAAYEVYRKLKSDDVEIATKVTEDLLDLLCVYNSEDPPEAPLAAELYLTRDVAQDDPRKMRKSWKDQGPAEMVFKDLKDPSVRAQSSLIRGRAKFFQCDKAFEMFQQLREGDVKPDVRTYNAVVGIASFLRDDATSRWEIIMSVLRDMSADAVLPDVGTFNAAIYALTRCKHHRGVTTWLLQTINEMKKCEIEPTLTTWYYALLVSYPHDEASSRILYSIIDYLKGKEFELRDLSDYDFFSCAMSKCYYNTKDLELAYKIDELLNTGMNMALLGDSFREGMYFTQFLRLQFMFEQIDKVMEYYELIVPNVYTPTFTVMDELLSAIELNDGYRYLPKIWSDFVLFQYHRRSDLVEHILRIIVRKKHEDSQLQEVFVKVANDLQKQYEADTLDQKQKRPIELSGCSIGDMALIHLYGDNFDKAWNVLQIMYVERRHQVNGFPSEKALVSMVEACMQRKDVDRTLQTLALMADFGYPKVDELALKVKDTMELSAHQKSHLEDLL